MNKALCFFNGGSDSIMKYLSYSILISFTFMSCGRNGQEWNYTLHEIVDVSFDKTDSRLTADNALDLISNINLVPLDTPESFIIPNIAQIRISDRRMYIFDKQQFKFICYSKDGKHIYTIDNRGRGPNEYLQPSNYSITPDGLLLIYDQATGRLLYFDSEGKFSHAREMPCPADEVVYLNDSLVVAYTKTMTLFNKEKETIKIIDNSGKIAGSFLVLPKWTYGSSLSSSSGSNFSYCNNSPRLTVPWCSNIFSITPDSVYCSYYLDYGKHSFPEPVLKENIGNIEDLSKMLKIADDGNWVLATDFFQENSGYVFFQSLKRRGLYYTLYDKRSATAHTVSRNNLPLEWALLLKPFLCSHENRFYDLVPASQLNMLAEIDDLTDQRIINLNEEYIQYKKDMKARIHEDDVLLLSFEMCD